MDRNRKRVNLCILSRAAGGRYEDADCFHQSCPLVLTKAQAEYCHCKTRTEVGRVGGFGYETPRGRSLPTSEQRVKVLECVYPNTYQGERIRNPQGFAAYIRKQASSGN
jgi:hypothetical protein